ncbi:MAG: DUF504 domain-containing protein [Methanomassiliicoccales archaeon]
MTYPRQVLNRMRWGSNGLKKVVITYVHRGGPDDLASVRGEDITELGRSFFTVGGAQIPYHRIIKIERDGETVFQI